MGASDAKVTAHGQVMFGGKVLGVGIAAGADSKVTGANVKSTAQQVGRQDISLAYGIIGAVGIQLARQTGYLVAQILVGNHGIDFGFDGFYSLNFFGLDFLGGIDVLDDGGVGIDA